MALSISIRADATQFSRTIAGVRIQMDGLHGGIANVATGAANLAASLAKVGIGITAVGGAMAAAFIMSSSKAAASMESLAVQMEVLTGSATRSKELIAEFREEAIKSPLSVSDYANAGKTLMAFGVSADSTLDILRTLGDVSMGNAERFGSLALAFAQTQAAGRLMGQEVLQFVNAGFNPLQEISRKTGRSMIELKKAMEDGAISAAMVTDAFRSATSQGGLFFGALDKGAKTTEGMIAKLGDTILGLKISFGTGFNEGLKSALAASSSFLPQLEAKLSTTGKVLGQALKQAAEGNLETFAQIGIIIGEALARGIQDVAGNALVEGTRKLLQSGSSDLTPEKRELMNRDIDRIIGKKRGINERAMDIADALRPEMEKLMAMTKNDPTFGPSLPNGYHENILRYEKEQAEYLKVISKNPFAAPPVLYSR